MNERTDKKKESERHDVSKLNASVNSAYTPHTFNNQFIQWKLGNQGALRYYISGLLQTKLTVSNPGDIYEQEADRVADQVMRMTAPKVQRVSEEEEWLQTKPITPVQSIMQRETLTDAEEKPLKTKDTSASTPQVDSSVESSINNMRGGGQPLPTFVREYFEPRFGYDFSNVKVHTDSQAAESAQAVNAKAFTLGQDVVFGAGEYKPDHEDGKRLIAHELTHVVQQNGAASAQINRNTIYREPAANERKLFGLPKGGVTLKTIPDSDPSHIFSGALVKNGDKIVIKNDNVQKMSSVKSGIWAWVEVPGKTSPQKDYPVMHGFIQTKYFNEVPKTEPAQPQQQQAVEPKMNVFGPSALSDDELESEINTMREWLKEHSDAKVAENLAVYEAEAMERVDKERKAAEAAKPPAAAPEADIGDLESALQTLKNGRYVSPLDQGASGSSGAGPDDLAKQALSSVDEKFLVPETDEMAINPVLRLEESIKSLEARIEKQRQSVANWSTEAKIKKAVESAIGQLGGELGERLKELLSPEAIAIMAAFVAAYIFSQLCPVGWLADIVVAGLIAATIIMLKDEAISIVELLIKFVEKAEGAKSISDINEAGQALAAAVTKAGVDIIVAILLHKAGKAANLKPPTPRSPGLVDALTAPKGDLVPAQRGFATSGVKINSDGTVAIDPGEFNMSMMGEPPEGISGPKGESGSGKGSGIPKAGADPAERPTGQGTSAGAGLPKEPSKSKKVPTGAEPGKPTAVDDSPGKKSADKPTGDTPKGDTPADPAASKVAPVEVDPQQGVKSAIERLDKKIADATAEISEKSKEITELSKEEWALRQKLKVTPRLDPGRAKMLEDLKVKQDNLTELKEQQEHRKALNNQDLETRTRLKNALEAKTYARPGFTEAERAKIWDQAMKDGNGKVISPSGVEIKPGDPWEVGHKPKYEFWKHVQSAAKRGISREQFLRECKDLDKYRPETKADNSSHMFEDKTDAYLGE